LAYLQPDTTIKTVMMGVTLPPTMQQSSCTLLQPMEEGVVVGGTMVGGVVPPTRGDENHIKHDRGKDKLGRVCYRHCKYCK
jgi:hypothetical protein